ncbi:hypothetical protein EDB89DRAFT_2240007 [Lactarius sanguifluus]|nr:hypothetical protein EDB89DRAFT_2240007 [Lactarius sanguifluus]
MPPLEKKGFFLKRPGLHTSDDDDDDDAAFPAGSWALQPDKQGYSRRSRHLFQKCSKSSLLAKAAVLSRSLFLLIRHICGPCIGCLHPAAWDIYNPCIAHAYACRADEAGQYITADKQSEHCLPTPIRERVDMTSDLRTDVRTVSFTKIVQPDARFTVFGLNKVVRPNEGRARVALLYGHGGQCTLSLRPCAASVSASTSVSAPTFAHPSPVRPGGGGDVMNRPMGIGMNAHWGFELKLISPTFLILQRRAEVPIIQAQARGENPPYDINQARPRGRDARRRRDPL